MYSVVKLQSSLHVHCKVKNKPPLKKIFESLEQMQEMWVCLQLGEEKIKAEIGYYGCPFAMLIIRGVHFRQIF